MIRMRALRSFRGAGEGRVRRGYDFVVDNERRAKELEEQDPPLAIRALKTEAIPQNKMDIDPQNKMEPALPNKAAEEGPLSITGGETGADNAPSSLPPDPPRQKRRYTRRKIALDS